MNCLSIHVVQHISCEKKDQEKVPSAYPRDFLCNGSQDLTLMVKEWLRIAYGILLHNRLWGTALERKNGVGTRFLCRPSWSVYRRCARYWRRSRRLKKAAPTWFPIGSTSTIPHAPACLAPRDRPTPSRCAPQALRMPAPVYHTKSAGPIGIETDWQDCYSTTTVRQQAGYGPMTSPPRGLEHRSVGHG